MFKQKFKNLPLGMTGLALGVTGIANAWSTQSTSNDTIDLFGLNQSRLLTPISNTAFTFQIIMGILAFVFVTLLLLRWVLHPATFKEEIKDPLSSSYMPTFLMAISSFAYVIGLISIYNQPFIGTYQKPYLNAGTIIASTLIIIATLLHLAFLIYFYLKIIAKHNFYNDAIYVSWLVPTCGIAVAGGFENGLGHIIPNEFFQVFWYIAFVNLIIFYLYMVYKHFFFKQLASTQVQSMGIFFAAPFLVLNGFLTIFWNTNFYNDTFRFTMILIILIFACFGTITYYPLVVKSFINKFNPGFAALSFPAAISALAMVKLANLFYNIMINTNGISQPIVTALFWVSYIISWWFLISGSLIISYILFEYFILIYAKLFK